MSISNYAEDKILDAVLNHTTTGGGLPTADVFVKLHTGDPGETGTANAATETTRKQASFAAASGGACASDAALTWTAVAAAETYAYISLWDAVSAGNNLWNGPLTTPKVVNAGDTFVIASGSLIVSLD